MHEWRLSGSVRNLGTESLTQKPTWSNHRLPLTAFETHNGRSTFAAGTALHAPYPTLAVTASGCWVGCIPVLRRGRCQGEVARKAGHSAQSLKRISAT